jgi:hypothetical protein
VLDVRLAQMLEADGFDRLREANQASAERRWKSGDLCVDNGTKGLNGPSHICYIAETLYSGKRPDADLDPRRDAAHS